MNGLTIELSREESGVFFELISSELRRLANEYDDDTGRIPGKRRMQARPELESVLKRWESAQPKIQGTGFVNLDAVAPCSLTLSGTERRACGNVARDGLKRMMRDLSDAPNPPEGVFAEIRKSADVAERIVRVLASA